MSSEAPGRSRILASLALLAGSTVGAATIPPEPNPTETPRTAYQAAIDVSLLSWVVRVVDLGGSPILGLAPQDLRVRVGKQEIPVVALDWIGPEAKTKSASEAESQVNLQGWIDGTVGATVAPAEGRLVVVFVQADFHPSRISGQMRLRPHTRKLLGTLHPQDRVAVASFDSHLKLWQDFSQDLEASHAAIDRAMVFSHEIEVEPATPHSLALNFERAAAFDAASPERALELLAQALEPLPGEKTVIYLGWGLGRFDGSGVHMTPAFKPAVEALRAARAAVFVLDVTSADAHSLEVGLQNVAEATGGLYFSTYRLPQVATTILAKAIAGYYVLTIAREQLAEQEGRVRIDLRKKNGTVLARPMGSP